MHLVLSPRLFGFAVGTRAALGFGIGLLVADRMPESRRRMLGLTMAAVGAITTIPAAMAVFRARRRDTPFTSAPKEGLAHESVGLPL